MNKFKIIFVISIIGLWGNLSVFSQYMNNIALWGSGGYSSFLTPSDDVFTKGNIGGNFGVGYELHYKRFLMQTGVEFGYYTARLGMDDFLHQADMIDDDINNEPYTGNFLFSENQDKYSVGNVNIPLMAGIQGGKFFIMLGGKVGINVLGKSSVTNVIKSSGTYDRFIEDFENMPNHDFLTQDQHYEYDIKFNINVSAAAEMGVYLGPSYRLDGKPKYRLSLYGEYGLLDIHNKSKKENLILNKRESPFYFPGLNSYMLANPLINKNVNTLYVGVKFTVLFQIPSKDCNCDEFLTPSDKRFWGIPWGNN